MPQATDLLDDAPTSLPIQRPRLQLGLAVAAWIVAFGVVVGLHVAGLLHRDVPYQVYRLAARHWQAHQPLYDTKSIDGFQYLPHCAMLLVPFGWAGEPLGGVLWRGLGWSLYAWGIWRMGARLAPASPRALFLVATALSIAPAVGSLGNGQTNLALGALMLHAGAELIGQRWWRATALLTLGLGVKPLMVVLILLAWALWPQMTWRLPLGLLVLFGVPFLAGDPGYVWAQYRACWAKLQVSSAPARLFEDSRGLVATLGWRMSPAPYFVVRVLAALGTLGLALRVRARAREPQATTVIVTLAALYLMLFNPRTQSNSYSIAAPLLALLAGASWLAGRRRQALAPLLVLPTWYGNSHVMRFPEFWLKPLTALVLAIVVVVQVLRLEPMDRSSRASSL